MEMVDAVAAATPSDDSTQSIAQKNSLHGRKDGIQGLSPLPLKVPKSPSFAERYRSPTDGLISPISKNLLARNRKTSHILPPAIDTPSKSLEPCFQDAGLPRT